MTSKKYIHIFKKIIMEIKIMEIKISGNFRLLGCKKLVF